VQYFVFLLHLTNFFPSICRPCCQTVWDTEQLDALLQTSSITQLYQCIIEHVLSAAETILPSGRSIFTKVMYIYYKFYKKY